MYEKLKLRAVTETGGAHGLNKVVYKTSHELYKPPKDPLSQYKPNAASQAGGLVCAGVLPVVHDIKQGDRIKELATRLKLSQRDVAHIVGCSRSAVYTVYKGIGTAYLRDDVERCLLSRAAERGFVPDANTSTEVGH